MDNNCKATPSTPSTPSTSSTQFQWNNPIFFLMILIFRVHFKKMNLWPMSFNNEFILIEIGRISTNFSWSFWMEYWNEPKFGQSNPTSFQNWFEWKMASFRSNFGVWMCRSRKNVDPRKIGASAKYWLNVAPILVNLVRNRSNIQQISVKIWYLNSSSLDLMKLDSDFGKFQSNFSPISVKIWFFNSSSLNLMKLDSDFGRF